MNKKIIKYLFILICAAMAALTIRFAATKSNSVEKHKKAGAGPVVISSSSKTAGSVQEINPLDNCAQEDKPLTAGELVSFILEWSDPQTGLLPTLIAKTGTKNPLEYYSYTYPDALACQALYLTGRPEEAAAIAETFRTRQEKYNLPNAFDYRSSLCADPVISAGPNAYWGISFLREYQLTKEEKWLAAAKQRADFLFELQDLDGGIRKTPFDTATEYHVKSTEENLDAYALFDLLFKTTGDDKYATARDAILRWLATSGVYNKKAGNFLIGTFKNKVTFVYGTDANALAVVILGPRLLDSDAGDCVFGGPSTAQKIIEGLEAARVIVDYMHPSGVSIKDVIGFDFTDNTGRPGRKPTVSPEFTAQAALAYLVMADDAKAKGDIGTATKFTEAAKTLTDNLGRIAARTGKSASLPYSTDKGIRRFSFDNWLTSSAEADVSAAWVVFPLVGFNPFAENGFELRDSLREIAPWLTVTEEPVISGRVVIKPAPEKIASGTELIAEEEANKAEALKPPVVYYKIIYEKVRDDLKLARRKTIAVLMISYNCWVDGQRKAEGENYDVIGIDADNKVVRKALSELPEEVRKALKEEYIHYDGSTGINWRLVSKYNLNIDYSRGAYYAFEIDGDYKIVKQFMSEADVPEANRADLKSLDSQYQSTAGLPEGHLIARYFLAMEVAGDMKIVRTYENVDELPGIMSKTPISRETYEKYLSAKSEERKRLIAAGAMPDAKGILAQEAWGIYYAWILGLDDTKRMRVWGISVKSGNEIMIGTRINLGDWKRNEIAKLNAIKYEEGLIDGMVIKPRKPVLGEKFSSTEPASVYLGKDSIERETVELKSKLLNLLKRIKAEKDAQIRQELIAEYDMLSSNLAWYDDEGFIHVIYYGVKAAEKRLKEFEKAKERAEASLRRYESILGIDEKGKNLRDFYGRTWLKVINEVTGRLLYVEVYDIAGNLETIFADNIKIDPLTKAVTSDTRTDIEYDKETYQMIGSHTYRTDENGDWAADMSEGIYKGYTPDKNHFVMERRVFLKDDSGRIILKDGKPRFMKKMEYYTPEGDLSAQIVKNIITTIKYAYVKEGINEVTKEVFVDPSYKALENEREDLENLVKGRVWTRRFKSTGRIISFKEELVNSLTSLPQEERGKAADSILNRLGAEKIGRIGDDFVLEENEVASNLSGNPASQGEAPYLVFYEPGDSLGRQRMVLRGGTIEIPVDWIPDKEVPAKTLSFNLRGELVSVTEIERSVRADSIFDPVYLRKFAVMEIEPGTLLPLSHKKIYRIVTGEDGLPHFTNTVAIMTVSYVIPDDVLGRELANIKYVMLGDQTTLHEKSVLKLKRNMFNQDTLVEVWKNERGEERRRAIAEKKETVIYEWYKEGLDLEQLREALKEELRRLPLKPKEVKEVLENIETAPFGTLPGYHTIKPNGALGEIKYFAGVVEYPRSEFGYKRVKVPYEPEVKPFSLPDGPPIKGVKYGVLNSDYAYYDVHSLSGQLIVLERRFVVLRLMNVFPIEGGRQTEYYDPLVPYSYLKPVKIEKYFAPGKQPAGEKPGVSLVAVFLGDASVYLKNGWQTQIFLERRPFDIDHWVRSDYIFDADGIYKYKKEHIEDSSIFLMKTTKWHKPLAFAFCALGLAILTGFLCRRRLAGARAERIERIGTKDVFNPSNCPALEELKAECVKVYRNGYPPAGLNEISKRIYRPLIEERFKILGADFAGYSAAIENLLTRITGRVGKQEITLLNLYPDEVREFEEWSMKFGRHFSFKDTGLFRDDAQVRDPRKMTEDGLKILVLFRLIFDESAEFKAAISSFRYYLFDKCLNMLIAGQEDRILREIQSDTWAFLEALRPGYGQKPALTKDRFFTYDDMKDLFEGKRTGFLTEFEDLKGQTKEQKLNYLATKGGQRASADVTDYRNYAWLKTFPDKQGVRQFVINIWRFWAFSIPIFIAVVGGGLAIALDLIPFRSQIDFIAGYLVKIFSPLADISAPVMDIAVAVNCLIAFGIIVSIAVLKGTLGDFNPRPAASGRVRIRSKAVVSFWIIFVLASYFWAVFSFFIVYWTAKIILKVAFLNAGWRVFIDGSAVVLTLAFIVSSFFSLFYILMATLGYFEGKREGVGQILSWAGARKHFEGSKKRFVGIFLSPADAAYADAAWNTFWNAMVQDLYWHWKLNENEKEMLLYSAANLKPDLSRPPRSEEARDRIKIYINSWLMDMPKAESWTELPTLTAMITAFNETISYSFDEVNGCDLGATTTRLNYLIGQYPLEWDEFVDRLSDADLGKFVTRDELKAVAGLRRMREGLPEALKEKITKWTNITVQCVEKSAREVLRIRDAFMMHARLCYPAASPEEISQMVDDKLQIMLNYEGYYKPFTKDQDRIALRGLMKELPHLEVYWDAGTEGDAGLHRYDPRTDRIELIGVAPRTATIRKGKPSGLNQALSYVKGETVLFFDANCSVRMEDAAKLPLALAEFRDDPQLAQILFSEYIFNKNYSWISQAIGFNEETFVSVTQRTLNIFEACGFYGHSAIIKTDAISASGGFPQDYVSEDILLATSLWQIGYKTTHKEYLILGKGRETSYFSSLVPFTKWAMGASDVALGRAIPNILRSRQVHVAQKFMSMFSFSFFYQTPLMFVINFLYLWLMICWGINGFMAVPYPIIFGILGLFFNQSITATGVAYIIERVGFRRALWTYLKLVGKNHFFYASAIPAYAFGFITGLKGKAIFIISPKGWNLGHLSLKAIWGEKRAVLMTVLLATIIGMPLLYTVVAAKMVPLWISPFIPFFPFATLIAMYLIGVLGVELGIKTLGGWRDEIIPDGDVTKMSVIKVQMIYAIVLLVFTVIGFIMWGIIFSSLAVKALFIFSVLYISTTLSFVLMPLFAHSQAVAIFKEITVSKLWNYLLIPLFSLAIILNISSVISGTAATYFETVTYTSLAVVLLISWWLLKWKLSGYASLDRWLRENIPAYRKRLMFFRSGLMDEVYFGHQEFLQGMQANKTRRFRRSRAALTFALIATITITMLLYFTAEFKVGFYSPWLWLLIALEIIAFLVLNIINSKGDRVYLRELIHNIRFSDLNRLNENVKVMDDIWDKMTRRYRNKLIEIYDDEVRAKKALLNYLSRCIRILSSAA